MSTATRPRPKSKRPGGGGAARWLWAGLGAVVLVLAVVAVAASRGGQEKGSDEVAGQTRPVQVSGRALPQLKDGPDTAVGQKAPELRGTGFDGRPVEITHDGRGKLVLFVAHWCPHCQREVPLLVDYLRDHSLPSGVDLVTVATATTPARENYPPSTWLERVHWTASVMADSADGTAANAYGLPGFPYFVAVGRDGAVVARTSGELPTEAFAHLAEQAAGGK
jgi:cytochrome c biogenesis protein CcmG, thiol:disulfide interchange protein DsbE